MEGELFTKRLREATKIVLPFTRSFVVEELPNQVLYLIAPNSSNDGNELSFDEEVFPEDSLPEGEEFRPATDEAGAVEFLWRHGKVPEWINVQVHRADANHSYISLVSCGRFTAGEGLYHLNEGIPPFHILSPPLPLGYRQGDRFRLRSHHELPPL